jgi:hypothetical protein
MKRNFAILPALLAGALALALQPQAPRPPAPGPELADYSILTERNIFLSTRRAAAPVRVPAPPPPPPPPPPARDPRADLVLRGTMATPQAYSAMIEDLSRSEIRSVQVGEKLLDETVTEISLEGIRLSGDEASTRTVTIGQTLAGNAASPARESPEASSAQREDADADSVLQRLMARRKQQTGRAEAPAAEEPSDKEADETSEDDTTKESQP